ncbi:HNH endonuclease [Azospirillum picis]|uniref:5-methylcytosine-specific restriction protein A n=1 Tax=Azospirillum picis TaxID=488438 RepID=A0ABU0MUZ1_9PROT|nr:HNH endonuclease signature motif containing protein [Azospirillum picis]MBP2303433.1 5-methylcytosine-specific restriction protein A [Azospirillum picis]MDQ0537308.1 5-methylcytosine-specific restriction protein A [Azospirillum picis]
MAPRLRSLRSPLAILDVRSGKAVAPMPSEQAEQDRKRRLDETRGSARQRGYDRDWEKLRDAVVIERGCRCEACRTIVVLRKREATATTPVAEVDHIESITDRPDLRLERSNLRVLCKPCHSGRTAKDQGFARG